MDFTFNSRKSHFAIIEASDLFIINGKDFDGIHADGVDPECVNIFDNNI